MSENEKMPANENKLDANALTDDSLEGASGGFLFAEASNGFLGTPCVPADAPDGLVDTPNFFADAPDNSVSKLV